MKMYPYVLLVVLCTAALLETSAGAAPDATGHWTGALNPAPNVKLRVALEILSADPAKPDGFMVSLDQGRGKIPLTALTVTGDAVHLEFKRISGIFDGKLSADGSDLSGEWKQRAGPMPLVFKRTAEPYVENVPRPQEPKTPLPYAEEEVVIENKSGGVGLAGTLTLPRSAGPHPAVVLITGSGAQDRNEYLPEARHKPFLVMADWLTRQGIVVLRCDDRGFAKSTGDFSRAVNMDFVSDALAQVSYLRTRREVDPQRIGLLGHSEGGIVASRAAVNSPTVAFIVVLGTIGLPMSQVVEQQARDYSRTLGLDDRQVEASVAVQAAINRIVQSEKGAMEKEQAAWQAYRDQATLLTEEQKKSFKVWESLLAQNLKTGLSPWYRDIMGYDPRATFALIKCPVLALSGARDLQVRAKENLAAIREALTTGGNTQSKAAELPNLNHLFQACQTGSPEEYAKIEETLNPTALRMISEWIAGMSSR